MCKPRVPDEEIAIEKLFREWNALFISRQKELDQKLELERELKIMLDKIDGIYIDEHF